MISKDAIVSVVTKNVVSNVRIDGYLAPLTHRKIPAYIRALMESGADSIRIKRGVIVTTYETTSM